MAGVHTVVDVKRKYRGNSHQPHTACDLPCFLCLGCQVTPHRDLLHLRENGGRKRERDKEGAREREGERGGESLKLKNNSSQCLDAHTV